MKQFLVRIKTDGLEYLLGKRELEPNRSSNELPVDYLAQWQDFHDGCMFDDEVVSARATLRMVEDYLRSNRPTKRDVVERIAYPELLKMKSLPAVDVTEADREENRKILEYLRLLEADIDREKEDKIIRLVKTKKYLGAAKEIQSCTKDASVHEYVLKIREIYGEDKIPMWHSVDQKVH